MKKATITFLQTVVVVIGVVAFIFMLWEPQVEGRNAHATQYQIYFNDPFLVWAYGTSIVFFIGVYQAFKALGYLKENKTFSEATVQALRIIRNCALILAASLGGALAYLFIVRPGDDIAGGVAMGLMIMFLSGVTTSAAHAFLKVVQKGIR